MTQVVALMAMAVAAGHYMGHHHRSCSRLSPSTLTGPAGAAAAGEPLPQLSPLSVQS